MQKNTKPLNLVSGPIYKIDEIKAYENKEIKIEDINQLFNKKDIENE